MSRAFDIILANAKQCSGRDLHLCNGGIFIKNLGEDGGILYLHKIFSAPHSSSLNEIENLDLNKGGDYYKFLIACNGVILYERSIYLFGYGDGITRSLEPECQVAVNAETEKFDFIENYSYQYADWRPIGAILTNKKFWICINYLEEVAIFSENLEHKFESFDECIKFVIDIFYFYCGCEAPDEFNLVRIEMAILEGPNSTTLRLQ